MAQKWSLLLLSLLFSATRAATCNASAYTVNLNSTQCYGLTPIPSIPTYSACFSACCALDGMMFQFCPEGSECSTYQGPSCWCGASNLSRCVHSPAVLWQGASQPTAPPPPPPLAQRFLPRSLATPPLSQLDLSDEGARGAWSLSVDGAPARPIRVPSGGYSSDFQDPPLIDQYAVRGSVVYSRLFEAPPPVGSGSVWHLAFGAVNHGARVYINGTLCGTHLGPMMPFEVDVTPALLAAAAAAPRSPLLLTVEALPYGALAGAVPSGFLYAESWRNDTNGWRSASCAGICRYIRLIELPPVRLTRLRTRAAVGPPATLTVTADVVNDSPVRIPSGALSLRGGLSPWNSGAAWPYPPVPPQVLLEDLAPGGGSGVLQFSLDWSAVGQAAWWWPNRPFSEGYSAQLHYLNVSLHLQGGSSSTASASAIAAAAAVAAAPPPPASTGSVRFGFVEHAARAYFWTLNGVRVNHLSDATPENGMSYYDAYAFSGSFIAQNPWELWRSYMRVGITSNRIHQSTPTEEMLRAADEVGFL